MSKSAASKLKHADNSTDLVEEVVAECRAHLAVIAQRRAELVSGGFDPALTSAAASLSRVLLAAETERRARVDRINVKAIKQWLLTASDDDRTEIVAALGALTSMKDVPLF